MIGTAGPERTTPLPTSETGDDSGHPSTASGRIVVKDVSRTFVDRTGSGELVALNGVDLVVEPGEFVSLVGPSGCGKSTLLMIMAGLLPGVSFGSPAIIPDRGPIFHRQ